MSKIEWTDATWNPVVGCSKVSPGCANCYAEGVARRFPGKAGADPWLPWKPENAAHNVVLRPDRLEVPLRWRKPRMVFVNSMSDLFHEQVPDAFIRSVFDVMARSPQHTFQVLTKRPERMQGIVSQLVANRREYAAKFDHCPTEAMRNSPAAQDARRRAADPFPNVWLGVSIENNRHAFRADVLRETPAAVRFISAEPLLGALDQLNIDAIDWLIAGGESGQSARPMHPDWVRDLRDRCADADTAFFFKQWGAWTPDRDIARPIKISRNRWSRESVCFQPDGTRYDGQTYESWHASTTMWRVGKGAAGRELDGRTWDEMPRLEVPA